LMSVALKMGVSEVCREFATNFTAPFIQELKRRAIIIDYNESKLTLESELKSMVAELGTAELKQIKLFDHDFATEVDLWVTSITSWADITVRGNSTAKAGFNLRKQFTVNIDHTTQSITIIFPEPELLSHEVNFEAVNLDDGWAVEIDEEKMNYVMVTAREDLRMAALDSDLYARATENAKQVAKALFQPLASASQYPYSVNLTIGSNTYPIYDYHNLNHNDIIL